MDITAAANLRLIQQLKTNLKHWKITPHILIEDLYSHIITPKHHNNTSPTQHYITNQPQTNYPNTTIIKLTPPKNTKNQQQKTQQGYYIIKTELQHTTLHITTYKAQGTNPTNYTIKTLTNHHPNRHQLASDDPLQNLQNKQTQLHSLQQIKEITKTTPKQKAQPKHHKINIADDQEYIHQTQKTTQLITTAHQIITNKHKHPLAIDLTNTTTNKNGNKKIKAYHIGYQSEYLLNS